MPQSLNPTIVSAKTGRSVLIGDCKTTFLVNSTDTGGLYCILEHDLPAGFPGPPPHAHRVTTHTFYVLEGQIVIKAGEEEIEVGAGSSIYIPAGLIHQFWNPNPTRARMMEIDTPGNFQAYFEELGLFFSSGNPMNQQLMAQIQQKYDFIPASGL